MPIQTRLVLATLCFFNGFTLTVLGAATIVFVDGRVRFVMAAAMWAAAVGLFGLARRLRRDVEWR